MSPSYTSLGAASSASSDKSSAISPEHEKFFAAISGKSRQITDGLRLLADYSWQSLIGYDPFAADVEDSGQEQAKEEESVKKGEDEKDSEKAKGEALYEQILAALRQLIGSDKNGELNICGILEERISTESDGLADPAEYPVDKGGMTNTTVADALARMTVPNLGEAGIEEVINHLDFPMARQALKRLIHMSSDVRAVLARKFRTGTDEDSVIEAVEDKIIYLTGKRRVSEEAACQTVRNLLTNLLSRLERQELDTARRLVLTTIFRYFYFQKAEQLARYQQLRESQNTEKSKFDQPAFAIKYPALRDKKVVNAVLNGEHPLEDLRGITVEKARMRIKGEYSPWEKAWRTVAAGFLIIGKVIPSALLCILFAVGFFPVSPAVSIIIVSWLALSNLFAASFTRAPAIYENLTKKKSGQEKAAAKNGKGGLGKRFVYGFVTVCAFLAMFGYAAKAFFSTAGTATKAGGLTKFLALFFGASISGPWLAGFAIFAAISAGVAFLAFQSQEAVKNAKSAFALWRNKGFWQKAGLVGFALVVVACTGFLAWFTMSGGVAAIMALFYSQAPALLTTVISASLAIAATVILSLAQFVNLLRLVVGAHLAPKGEYSVDFPIDKEDKNGKQNLIQWWRNIKSCHGGWIVAALVSMSGDLTAASFIGTFVSASAILSGVGVAAALVTGLAVFLGVLTMTLAFSLTWSKTSAKLSEVFGESTKTYRGPEAEQSETPRLIVAETEKIELGADETPGSGNDSDSKKNQETQPLVLAT